MYWNSGRFRRPAKVLHSDAGDFDPRNLHGCESRKTSCCIKRGSICSTSPIRNEVRDISNLF